MYHLSQYRKEFVKRIRGKSWALTAKLSSPFPFVGYYTTTSFFEKLFSSVAFFHIEEVETHPRMFLLFGKTDNVFMQKSNECQWTTVNLTVFPHVYFMFRKNICLFNIWIKHHHTIPLFISKLNICKYNKANCKKYTEIQNAIWPHNLCVQTNLPLFVVGYRTLSIWN